jgi:hypothetical protein
VAVARGLRPFFAHTHAQARAHASAQSNTHHVKGPRADNVLRLRGPSQVPQSARAREQSQAKRSEAKHLEVVFPLGHQILHKAQVSVYAGRVNCRYACEADQVGDEDEDDGGGNNDSDSDEDNDATTASQDSGERRADSGERTNL